MEPIYRLFYQTKVYEYILGLREGGSNLNVCGEGTIWAHSASQKKYRSLKVQEQGSKRS